MSFKRHSACNEILAHYGIGGQLRVLAEECCELAQAALKNVRMGIEKPYGNLVEEIADVLLMIEQVVSFYGIEEDQMERIIEWKIDRQFERMKEGM